MLVVGRDLPQRNGRAARAHPALWFLVPGIGAQGGDLESTLAAGLDAHGTGLLISSSRAIIYAGGGVDRARSAARRRRCAHAINRKRGGRT